MDKQQTMISSKVAEASAPRVLIISDDKFNDLELFYPYYRMCEAGLQVEIASPAGGEIKGDHSFSIPSQKRVADCRGQDYVLLYLPGGKAPSSLREDENVLKFVREFAAAGKPIAAICHAAQILASADVIRGKRIAAWPEVKDEVEEAGASFVHAPLVEDGLFITARWPGDLPGHLEATLKHVKSEKPRVKSAA